MDIVFNLYLSAKKTFGPHKNNSIISLVRDEKDYDFMRRFFTTAEVSLYLSHAYCLLF
jgi:hypothetical protein